MCIAIFKPADKKISRETLRQCWDTNSHGAGFMYALNGKLIVRKGFMNFQKFWAAYQEVEGYSLGIHFRISTGGGVNPENTHPFKVNRGVALIHNGILPISVPHDSKLSDTALFCRDTLGHLPENFMHIPGILNLIENFMESYRGGYKNKIVFMDATGKVVILGEKYGIWDGGIWYSNDSYLPSRWFSSNPLRSSGRKGRKNRDRTPILTKEEWEKKNAAAQATTNAVSSGQMTLSLRDSVRKLAAPSFIWTDDDSTLYDMGNCGACGEPLTQGDLESYECPNCQHEFESEELETDFCFNCGRMFLESALYDGVCHECKEEIRYNM